MTKGALGKQYKSGEIIARQGEVGDCMYVIQEGQVQVSIDQGGVEVPLRVAGEGEFMGEMSIFDRVERSATLKALGDVRLLTIDKKNFLKRIHEDPGLAFRLVQTMSIRVRELGDELASFKRQAEPGDSVGQAARKQDH